MSGGIKVTFVDAMGTDLTPVNSARISFNSSSDEMTEKDKKLIKYLADHLHMTPFEHNQLSVLVEVPLYIRSQIHRHRTFSYSEVSRRYTADNVEFYVPEVDDIRVQSKSNKQGSEGPIDPEQAGLVQAAMVEVAMKANDVFEKLLQLGVAREQARAILPQCTMTKFIMTGNLRNWCHFLKLRLDPHAQKEARVMAQQVAEIIKERWPVSYSALMGEANG
jgi:thymidylate synthase (FAD)